jgi:hypothetical protein
MVRELNKAKKKRCKIGRNNKRINKNIAKSLILLLVKNCLKIDLSIFST